MGNFSTCQYNISAITSLASGITLMIVPAFVCFKVYKSS